MLDLEGAVTQSKRNVIVIAVWLFCVAASVWIILALGDAIGGK